MKQVTHFKPNVCYEIAIHGVYHYVGCHTQECKSFLTEKEILIGSGNYLKNQIKKTITRQEYYDCVELIKVWEFDDKQSALDFEAKQIQECKRVYKDLCVNKALYGNKSGSKGVEWSEEHKQRMSDAVSGEKNGMYGRVGSLNPMYGKHRTEEEKRNISESRKGKTAWNKGQGTEVLQFTKDGQFVAKYSNASEASRKTGIDSSQIAHCCRGNPHYKSAGEYIWKYA